MEREMCSYLEWQLNIEPEALKEFEAKVRRDFKGQGPYPTYVLPSPAPTPVPSTTPYGATSNAPPSFAARPSTSPPKPTPMPVEAYPSPPTSPDTPETPEATHSLSTSPASSVSPPTPSGEVDLTVKIATAGGSVPMSVDAARRRACTASMRARGESAARSCSRLRSASCGGRVGWAPAPSPPAHGVAGSRTRAGEDGEEEEEKRK